ncbi:hypothetical protein CRG98_001912 [Punica granatum]|uniref:Uncharacterized protein n=1 Tax=Punica granatum TaxID=22663 RepID=A0A2I0LAH2_PUNGR|nr:hypothetical protein CRG98_001912 [Punica granatum]
MSMHKQSLGHIVLNWLLPITRLNNIGGPNPTVPSSPGYPVSSACDPFQSSAGHSVIHIAADEASFLPFSPDCFISSAIHHLVSSPSHVFLLLN